jgi:hypothetical protein
LGLFAASAAQAQQDLVLPPNSSYGLANGETFRNIVLNPGSTLHISRTITVTSSLVVKSGATLYLEGGVFAGTGSFELQDGGILIVGDPGGLTRNSTTTGEIRLSGTRYFSPKAQYHYVGSNNGPQVTGDGLPSSVLFLRKVTVGVLSLSQDLTVTGMLTHSSNLNLNGHRLTLASTAAGTAWIANWLPGSTSQIIYNGGTVTVQRYLPPDANAGLGYRHLSVPLSGATVASLAPAGGAPTVNAAYNTAPVATQVTPFPTVFGYDEQRVMTSPATDLAAFDKGWVSPAALTDALAPGRGYTVQVAGGQTLEWTGQLNYGTVNVPLTRTGGSAGGWHLVGNPFTSPVDWRLMTLPATIDNAMYVYQSTSRYGGQYRSYVNGVGASPLLAVGQGFFVRVNTPGATPTLSFTNAVRDRTYLGPDVPYVRPTTDDRPLVQVQLRGAGATLSDDAYVYFEAGATPGVDSRYDALKMQHNSGGAPTLYAQAAGAELSINGLPALTSRTVVPLGLELPAAGGYTLRAADLNNLAGTAGVYLHDAVTGQTVDLQRQASYGFTAAAGPLTGRFELRFEPGRPTAARPGLTAASVSVYPNPAKQSFTVLMPAVAGAWQAQAGLFNSLGQQVQRQVAALPAAGARLTFDSAHLPAGVYTIRLLAGQEMVVKRVVVE